MPLTLSMANLTLTHILFIFMLFMFIGWVQESLIESLYNKKIINRGFLIGPYIPVYGFGGLIIVLICLPFSENPEYVFFLGVVSCTLLENATGAAVEKILKKQLWDYSKMNMKFVYKNRISLLSSIFWGVMSLVVIYVLFPRVKELALSVEGDILLIAVIIMYVVFTADLFVQVNNQVHIRQFLSQLKLEEAKRYFNNRYDRIGNSVKKRIKFLHEKAEKTQLAGFIRNFKQEYEVEKDDDSQHP